MLGMVTVVGSSDPVGWGLAGWSDAVMPGCCSCIAEGLLELLREMGGAIGVSRVRPGPILTDRASSVRPETGPAADSPRQRGRRQWHPTSRSPNRADFPARCA